MASQTPHINVYHQEIFAVKSLHSLLLQEKDKEAYERLQSYLSSSNPQVRDIAIFLLSQLRMDVDQKIHLLIKYLPGIRNLHYAHICFGALAYLAFAQKMDFVKRPYRCVQQNLQGLDDWCDVQDSSLALNYIDIDIVDDVGVFYDEYVSLNKPVILRNQAHEVDYSQWKKSEFLKRYGDVKVDWKMLGKKMTFDEYVKEYFHGRPQYGMDQDLYFIDVGEVASAERNLNNAVDLPKCLLHPSWARKPNETRGDYFFIGPPGSGTHLHAHCNAMNLLVVGKKRWFLYPPTYNLYQKQFRVPKGTEIIPIDWERMEYPLIDMLRWFKARYESLEHKPLEVIQEAGDLLYVPSGWMHAVLNISDCLGKVWQMGFSQLTQQRLAEYTGR